MKTTEQKIPGLIANILKWVLLLFFLFVTIYPIFWLFLASFKGSNLELQTNAFGLPEVWHFENYVKAMQMAKLPSLFWHSILVSAFAVSLNLIVSAMASFVISREKFFGKDVLLTIIIAGVLIPIISFMVPYFTLIQKLHMYDTLWALILTYSAINIPISVFLLTSFMKSIPVELEEAATIDGCSFAQRFTKIVFPSHKQGWLRQGHSVLSMHGTNLSWLCS